MTEWTDRLLDRVRAGDGDGVLAVISVMTEAERRACASDVVSVRHLWPGDGVSEAEKLAEWGVLPPSRLRSIAHGPVYWHMGSRDPRFEQIVRLRPRDWRQRLVRRANWALGLPWPVVYRLVCDGLVDPPQTPWYYAASTAHINLWRDDPAWLAEDFWQLFTHEEAALELSHGGGTRTAYAGLVDSGRVPRPRVLAACLDALRRDFPPRATRFYRNLFDAVGPTPDDLAPLAPRLLVLLASDNPLDVGFALVHLTALQSAGSLDGRELCNALAPAMTAPTKKHALAAIALAGSALRTDPDLADAAVAALGEALLHPRTDVQRIAFAEIEPFRDHLPAETIAYLELAREDVDPSILTALNVSFARPQPALTQHPSSLREAGQHEPPAPEEAVPQPQRWSTEWRHRSAGYMWAYTADFLDRFHELSPPRGLNTLLSTPVHRSGWIEPAVAARRLWYLEGTPAAWDLALMVLRLMPDHDAAGRAALRHLDSEEAAVVRHALGEDVSVSPSTELASAWSAARAVRDPKAYEADARGAGARLLEEAKSIRWQHSRWLPPLPDDLLGAVELLVPSENMLPWLATIWPGNREPLFRCVVRQLWRVPPDGAPPPVESAVGLLADGRAPAGPEAGLALALALGVRDVGLSTFAVETAATAIAQNLVDARWLGAGLARALREHRGITDNPTAGTVPKRWVVPLEDIARQSDAHAHVVHEALQGLLASASASDRRALSDVISLLRRLSLTLEKPVENATARAFLQALSPSSLGGQAAREILALCP